MSLYALARPLLFSLDPETAHQRRRCGCRFGPAALSAHPAPARARHGPRLSQSGRPRRRPRQARGARRRARRAWASASSSSAASRRGRSRAIRSRGFSAIVGEQAIINRFGFNSVGVDRLRRNLKRARAQAAVIGVNIGKNKDTPTERAADDYERCLEVLYPRALHHASTSPRRTPRACATCSPGQFLATLLRRHAPSGATRCARARPPCRAASRSPPTSTRPRSAISRTSRGASAWTASSRPTPRFRAKASRVAHRGEEGGLSGAPLRAQLDRTWCAALARTLQGELPIIGVRRHHERAPTRARSFDAGATLVQIYTGLVYRGPELVPNVCRSSGHGKSASRRCNAPRWISAASTSSSSSDELVRLVAVGAVARAGDQDLDAVAREVARRRSRPPRSGAPPACRSLRGSPRRTPARPPVLGRAEARRAGQQLDLGAPASTQSS